MNLSQLQPFFAITAFAWNSVKRQKRLPSEFVKNEYEYYKRRLKPRTRFYKYNWLLSRLTTRPKHIVKVPCFSGITSTKKLMHLF